MATSTPLSHAERGALGARVRNEILTPERRREIASNASLKAAVAIIAKRAPELTPDQVTKLRGILAPVEAA